MLIPGKIRFGGSRNEEQRGEKRTNGNPLVPKKN
jgi:hypothetical protein